jgi:hypothetical protein
MKIRARTLNQRDWTNRDDAMLGILLRKER